MCCLPWSRSLLTCSVIIEKERTVWQVQLSPARLAPSSFHSPRPPKKTSVRSPLSPPWHRIRILAAKGKKREKILKAMLFPVGWHHRFGFHQREQRANLTPAQTDVTLELWVSNERGITRWTTLWKQPNAPALGFSIETDGFSELCFKVPGFRSSLFIYFPSHCALTLVQHSAYDFCFVRMLSDQGKCIGRLFAALWKPLYT